MADIKRAERDSIVLTATKMLTLKIAFQPERRSDMARRIVNRRELRQQAEQAEAVAVETPVAEEKTTAKKKPAAKPRASRAKKAPVRQRARWGVFDTGMKQVAVFDYNQRAAADQKVADLNARKKGEHFLQIVKDAMPEPSL